MKSNVGNEKHVFCAGLGFSRGLGLNQLLRQAAVNTLSDPFASEASWIQAAEILGSNYRPIVSRRGQPRLLQKVFVLTIAYALAMSIFALIGQHFAPWMHHYTIYEILPLAFYWAAVEAFSGLATIFGAFTLIAGFGSPGWVFNPSWLMVPTGLVLYLKYGWHPTIVVILLERTRLKQFISLRCLQLSSFDATHGDPERRCSNDVRHCW